MLISRIWVLLLESHVHVAIFFQVYVPVAILLLVTLQLVYAAQEIDLLANQDELDKPRQRRNCKVLFLMIIMSNVKATFI